MIRISATVVGKIPDSEKFMLVLRGMKASRYLFISIGSMEAHAIYLGITEEETTRPLTHDLLHNTILEMGASVSYTLITKIEKGTYHSRISLEMGGSEIRIDARPSDAVALAVRADAPMYVSEAVMDQEGVFPEGADVEAQREEEGPEVPEVFRDFLESLDG